jgi:3-oxoacyl-[acyl-carrier-protein] synthase II
VTGSNDRAIAVTGIGVMAPGGTSLDTFWDTIVAGHSCAHDVQRVDVSESPIRFGCEADDFDPLAFMSEKQARRTDRNAQLTIAAAEAAFTDAGEPDVDAARVAVVVGTGFGGLETADNSAREFLGVKTPGVKGRVNPLFVPMAMANAGAALVSMRRGFRGPCLTISTACSAGANAIGEGARLLREGSADLVIALGAEAPLTPWVMAGFAAARALSSRSGDPGTASRPFDLDRDGFVIGEAGAALVLERLPDAVARRARVRAELLGYARNTDAYHLVAPPPDGRGAHDCMRLALENAGLSTRDVAHVNAHGTSTPHNDAAEAAAIRALFEGSSPPVTSVKGVLGHSIGAAGAVEAVASVLTLERRVIPPTANYATPDPAADLDIVVEPRALGDGAVMSNSFAFGGHNAVLVFGRH